MRRLVYAPKAFAWVQADERTWDLSDDIVSGSVTRRVNQVSQAEIVLRNPDMKYTVPAGNPAFHPMDKITIYLQRLPGHPIQVFTGYLDSTPYLALYPGNVTLTASCTLKRLLYTFWDMGLPFVFEFLQQYGWQTNYADGNIFNPTADTARATTAPGGKAGQNQSGKDPKDDKTSQNGGKGGANGGGQVNPSGFIDIVSGDPDTGEKVVTKGKPSVHLDDGSIGKLLYGILTNVAKWPEDQIHIENLPPQLPEQIAQIYSSFHTAGSETQQLLQAFFEKIIGSDAGGAGVPGAGGPAGNGKLICGQPTRWTASTFSGSNGAHGSNDQNGGMTFAELSTNPGAGASGCDFKAMGDLPPGKLVKVCNGSNCKVLKKTDVGCGGGGLSGTTRGIDLYGPAARALGVSGTAVVTVEPVKDLQGTPCSDSSTTTGQAAARTGTSSTSSSKGDPFHKHASTK